MRYKKYAEAVRDKGWKPADHNLAAANAITQEIVRKNPQFDEAKLKGCLTYVGRRLARKGKLVHPETVFVALYNIGKKEKNGARKRELNVVAAAVNGIRDYDEKFVGNLQDLNIPGARVRKVKTSAGTLYFQRIPARKG